MKAGDEEPALQRGTAISNQIQYMTLEAVKCAVPGQYPTDNQYSKAAAYARQAACVGICRNEEALCTAQQTGSRAQSVMGFSDSQLSCLVITPTLINFEVQR